MKQEIIDVLRAIDPVPAMWPAPIEDIADRILAVVEQARYAPRRKSRGSRHPHASGVARRSVVARAQMIVAPGSPEDVLQCQAWPGSQVCPVLSTLKWRLGLIDDERARLRREGRDCNLSPGELLASSYERVSLQDVLNQAMQYSTHKSPCPDEWDDIDETHARVSKATRER